jgi:hypothetical protein
MSHELSTYLKGRIQLIVLAILLFDSIAQAPIAGNIILINTPMKLAIRSLEQTIDNKIITASMYEKNTIILMNELKGKKIVSLVINIMTSDINKISVK